MAVVAQAKQNQFSVGTLKIQGGGGGRAFVVGGTGKMSTSVIRDMVKQGVSVTAGVVDMQQGRDMLQFVKTLGLLNKNEVSKISLVELDGLDADSLTALVPRGSSVIACLGDELGPRLQVGTQVIDSIAEAAAAASAARIVLVTPVPVDAGFLGLFGGGPSAKPSPSERAVAAAGVPYAIVRHGTIAQADAVPGGLAVDPAGTLGKQARASRAQVAAVTVAAMKSREEGFVVEVSASAGNASASELLEAALEGREVEGGAEEYDEEDEEEEEAEAPQAGPKFGLPFGKFGTQKVAVNPAGEADE